MGKEAIKTCLGLHRKYMIEPGFECTKQVTQVSVLLTLYHPLWVLLFLPGINGSLKEWIDGMVDE